MQKLYSLQAIRAIAALVVVVYHAAGMFNVVYGYKFLYGAFSTGYFGVDLFFVLSGFVIFYIHSKDIMQKEKVTSFLRKRFIRVYPIYWVVFILLCIQGYLLNTEINTGNLIKSFLLLPEKNAELLVLSVSWSLSHEILFYAMFALIIYLNTKVSIPLIVSWVMLTVIFFFLNLTPWSIENFWLSFIFSPYNLEFFAGVSIAYIILKKQTKHGNYGLFFVLLSVSIFIGAWFIENHTNLEIQRVILFGIPSAFLIYGAVSSELALKFKIPKILRYLGDASYSIYLVHYPILSTGNKIFSVLNIYNIIGLFGGMVLLIISTTIMGCLFHSFVEKKVIKSLNRIFKKDIIVKEQASL